MRRLVFASCFLAGLFGSASVVVGQNASPANDALGRPGALDGVWLWKLPDTPNGLRPSQSWHATASVPDGDIYVAGMDHKTNSALYRLNWRAGALGLVGDARSASEAVGNWLPGETAQKFHTRPLWHKGKVYVATMNRSTLDDGYLTERGFHWYAYDPKQKTFADLSAAEPNGAAVDHGNVVSLASDPARNLIYAAGVPTGEIFRYDVAGGTTTRLGRPAGYDQPYVYSGRVMWVDSRGRLYFTASNSATPTVFKHIYYYDPGTGFGERKDWSLKEAKALEVGQCVNDNKRCFFSDDKGHVYRFDDDGPSWSYLGQIETGQQAYLWLFDVSADGVKAYAGTSWASDGKQNALFEFDLTTATTARLCNFEELAPSLEGLDVHTGYAAWDPQGRFYFASFSGRPNQRVVFTRVDIARVRRALSSRDAQLGAPKRE